MTIPVGFAQVTHEFSGINVPTGAAVVYGVSNVPADSAAAIAAGIDPLFAQFVIDCCSPDVTLETTKVKLGPDATGASAEFSGEGGTGGNGTTSLSPGSALLFTKNTALGGRRGRGRMYLPGVAEVVVNDAGGLEAGAALQFQTAADALLQDLETAGWPMFLLHSPPTEWQIVNGQSRRIEVAGSVPAPTEVTSLTVSSTIATQRRRLRR